MDNNTETATANDGKQTSATAAGYGAISLFCCFYIDKTEYGHTGIVRSVVTVPFLKYYENTLNGSDCLLNNATAMKEIPVWEKFLLTVKEASLYFNIGENKLHKIVNDYMDSDYRFIIQNGSRAMINRRKFEDFLNQTTSI